MIRAVHELGQLPELRAVVGGGKAQRSLAKIISAAPGGIGAQRSGVAQAHVGADGLSAQSHAPFVIRFQEEREVGLGKGVGHLLRA